MGLENEKSIIQTNEVLDNDETKKEVSKLEKKKNELAKLVKSKDEILEKIKKVEKEISDLESQQIKLLLNHYNVDISELEPLIKSLKGR